MLEGSEFHLFTCMATFVALLSLHIPCYWSQHFGVNPQGVVCAGVLQRAVEGGAVGGQAGHL